ANRATTLVDELRLEADRRAVGDDLHVMVGEPRQERTARDIGNGLDVVADAAFLADRSSNIWSCRIVAAFGKIEQDRMRPEILDAVGFQVLDRRIVPPFEQRTPVIIGPPMHSALV